MIDYTSFDDYQDEASQFAFWRGNRAHQGSGIQLPVYCALGLVGEAGEVANKIKKIYRDHNGIVDTEMRESIIEELGDVLWYIGQLADVLDVALSDVAAANIDKLSERYRGEDEEDEEEEDLED